MDVRLQNAYVQVLLDNFMEVVKQNLMLQAQLSVSNTQLKEIEDSKRRIDELSNRNVELQSKISELESVKAQNTTTANAENRRLQLAVNDYMRQLNDANKQILSIKAESQEVLLSSTKRIEELTKYIQNLENNMPAAKLKKLRQTESTHQETPEATEENIEVKSGGTF